MKKLLSFVGFFIMGTFLLLPFFLRADTSVSLVVTHFSSSPEEYSTLYSHQDDQDLPSSTIKIFYDLEVDNLYVPEEEHSLTAFIEATTNEFMYCPQSELVTTQVNGSFGLSISCTLFDELTPGSIYLPDFQIQANLDGEILSVGYNHNHQGFLLETNILQQGENEFVSSSFSVTAHPNRLLNRSSRNTPRADKADILRPHLLFTQSDHSPEFAVYPELGSGTTNNYSSNTTIYPCDGRSNCSGSACSKTYYSDQPLTSNNDGRLQSNVQVYYYSPTDTNTQVIGHLTDLSSDTVSVDIHMEIPPSYPELQFDDESYERTKTYTLKDIISGESIMANDLIRDGGIFSFPQNDFISHALQNGKQGSIFTDIAGSVEKTIWEYREDTSENNQLYCPYSIRHYYSCNCGEDGCSTCSYTTHHTKSKYYPVFKWFRISGPTEVTWSLKDTTNVDVFSSTAWVQTKGGNMGTNNNVKTSGSEFNQFKYSSGEDFGDIDYDISSGSVETQPLDYTPEGQSNAEFMIFAKPEITNDIENEISLENAMNNMKFTSAADWYTFLENESIFDTKKEQQKYGYNSQGEEYDRSNNPRNFLEDLLERQIYGEVIDFSTLSDEDFLYYGNQQAGNIQRVGDTISIKNTLLLERGKVYYFPESITIVMGSQDTDLFLDGSSTRIQAMGEVRIAGNILYTNSAAKSYLNIPYLRINADTIKVHGSVEFLESSLRARVFYSGVQNYEQPTNFSEYEPSNIQLKILGDVIADETHFQRSPASLFNPEDMEDNPPSEMIIEDMRKFIVPAPGDTISRESQSAWQQVNPLTGKVIDPYED